MKKCAADNERFCESGGVCPPELMYEFTSAPPAQAFVSPPPSQSCHHVARKRATVRADSESVADRGFVPKKNITNIDGIR
jgi:hypothetical protein